MNGGDTLALYHASNVVVMTACVVCGECWRAGKRGPEAHVIDPTEARNHGGALSGRWRRMVIAAVKRHYKANHPERVLPVLPARGSRVIHTTCERCAAPVTRWRGDAQRATPQVLCARCRAVDADDRRQALEEARHPTPAEYFCSVCGGPFYDDEPDVDFDNLRCAACAAGERWS